MFPQNYKYPLNYLQNSTIIVIWPYQLIVCVMKRNFEKLTKKVSRRVHHWWLMLLAGILCIAAGIAVFIFPLESYFAISVLVGIVMLVVGAAQLVTASTSENYLAMRGYFIVGGVLDLLLGLFLCVYPGITLMVLPIMMGIWLMYHSFMMIAFGGDLDTFNISGSGVVVAGGVLVLILSVIVLANPFSAGIATIVVLAGVGLLLLGVLLCTVSVTLKGIHLNEEELPEM